MARSAAAIRAAQRLLVSRPVAPLLSPFAQRSNCRSGSEGLSPALQSLREVLVPLETSARSPRAVTSATSPCAPALATSSLSFAASGYADLVAAWQVKRGYSVDASSVSGTRGSDQLVLLDYLTGEDEGIAVLTLNRPAARNAISKQLLADLKQALGELEGGRSAGEAGVVGELEGGKSAGDAGVLGEGQKAGGGGVRAVIIRSALDGVFCAGADLKERRGMTAEEAGAFVSSLRNTFTALENISVPTVAAVEGAALGGGLEMLLACDIRVAGFNARFGLPETSLAIIPGAGGTQRLPRLIGPSRAKELMFTARVVRADEALSLGIVSHCVPAGAAYDKSLEIARAIQNNGPLAVRLAKKAIDSGLNVTIKDGLAIEECCYQEVLKSKDRLEGLAAFAEKRKPVYNGV